MRGTTQPTGLSTRLSDQRYRSQGTADAAGLKRGRSGRLAHQLQSASLTHHLDSATGELPSAFSGVVFVSVACGSVNNLLSFRGCFGHTSVRYRAERGGPRRRCCRGIRLPPHLSGREVTSGLGQPEHPARHRTPRRRTPRARGGSRRSWVLQLAAAPEQGVLPQGPTGSSPR